MRLPKITDDRQWANADWPEIPWLNSAKSKAKKSTKTAAVSALKKVYYSQWLRNKVKDKLFISQKVEKLADDTYRITTDFVFQSFLFVGKKSALLVDTGVGLGDLKSEVAKLTDKPLTVACTHAHFDATGGAGQFENVKISKSDKESAKVYNFISRHLLKHTGKIGKDVINKPNFVALTSSEIEKGFDLGGRTVKVILAPSHTRGSLCFIDEENKLAIVGDVISPLGFQLFPFALPLNEYVATLEKLLPKLEDKKIYCSYFPKAFDYAYASDLKTTYFLGQATGNDTNYKKQLRFRKSNDKKLILLSYASKANRRERKTRMDAFKRGDYKL
ncbi:MAG: MBL fold metallo-hydrolase [Clostridia bacterium]|nr:MBL fold metallo-hydrolase [Clostridia bacterium]